MWDEIFAWMEKFSGVSYDMSEDFAALPKEYVFAEPMMWKTKIMNILNTLEEALDVVDEHKDEIPDYMPDAEGIKTIYSSYVIQNIMLLVNYAKSMLCIDEADITSYTDLVNQIQCISDIIKLLNDSSLGDDSLQKSFEEYNEDNDNAFTEVFGINVHDLSNMKMTVDDLKELYLLSTQDEDDDVDIEEET